MDWADSPEQAEFRATVRAFFEEKLPAALPRGRSDRCART